MTLQDIKSLSHQNFSRYMFFKWRNAILRPTKHNSERNATIITSLFSLFLTASRIISPPPCVCFLLFHHSSNARKKTKNKICSFSSKAFYIFLLCSHVFSLLKFLMHITLTAHTWSFLTNGETTNDFKKFLMRLLRNSLAALNMFC